jgi:adenine phosphoribosyltransferase
MTQSPPDAAESLPRRIAEQLRMIPDFPRPGIAFQDLCGVFAVPALLGDIAAAMVAGFDGDFDRVVAVEARGFVIGTVVAHTAGRPLVLARKKGKLPGPVHQAEYELEYGVAVLETQRGALPPGERVLIVDDVLATGGTLAATADLATREGATVTGHAVVLEIGDLCGAQRLAPHKVFSLLSV